MKNKRKPGTNVFAGGFYTYPIVAETYDGYPERHQRLSCKA